MRRMTATDAVAAESSCRSSRTGTCSCTSPATARSGRAATGCSCSSAARGPYVFDTEGRRYLDGAGSSLFCCQIGYSFGEEMAAVAGERDSRRSRSTRTGRPPTRRRSGLAAALAERAPSGMLFDRGILTCGGSESVEAAWKIIRQSYLARGEPQRTKAIAREIAYHGVTLGALFVHRRAADEGAVRRVAHPGRPGVEHEPVPAQELAATRRRTARSCWTRWSGRSWRPGRRRWR